MSRLRGQPHTDRPREFREEVPGNLEADQSAIQRVELLAATDPPDRGRDHVVVHERQDAGPEARRFLLSGREPGLFASDLARSGSYEQDAEPKTAAAHHYTAGNRRVRQRHVRY